MEPHQQFEQLLKRYIAPLLKSHGFSRRRHTFDRRIGQNWTVINLQKSSKTTAEQVVFTVNLGVASAPLTEFEGGDPEKRPGEHDCHLREGLGFLLPDPHDRWWVLDRETPSPDHVAATLSRHLAETALPYLERHASDEALRDLWLETKRYDWRHLSVLLRTLGPADALDALIADTKEHYKFNAAAQAEIAEHERRLEAFAAERANRSP